MAEKFSWIPLHEEAARHLLGWEDRQKELISFLEELRKDGLKITPLNDQDNEGARFLLTEIDPFTCLSKKRNWGTVHNVDTRKVITSGLSVMFALKFGHRRSQITCDDVTFQFNDPDMNSEPIPDTQVDHLPAPRALPRPDRHPEHFLRPVSPRLPRHSLLLAIPQRSLN
jgi:hypothetical protein